MELKKYKKIKNTKTLPGFDYGKFGFNPAYNPYSFNNQPMTYSTPFTKPGGPTSQDLFGKSMLQMDSKEFFNQPMKNSAKSQYWKGVGKNALANAGSIATSTVDAVNSISNSFKYDKTADDMLSESGTFGSTVRGINVEQQNYADQEALTKELNATNKANIMKSMSSGSTVGSSVGSIFGPVGGAIGGAVGTVGGLVAGLFGSKKRKEEMRKRILEANKKALLANRESGSSAASKAMQLEYEEENGSNGMLYAFDKGKDSGRVVTPYGKTKGSANSRVSVGEPVLDNLDDLSNTVGYVPKNGKPHADDNYANLSDSSVVLGSNVDWRNGLTFMDQGKPYTLALEKINKKYETRSNKKIEELRGSFGRNTDEIQQKNVNKLKEPIVELLNDLANQQQKQHEIENNMAQLGRYKCGKDKKPGYDIGKEGWLSNFVPSMIGAGLSLKQYYDAKDQPLHSPDIYTENPYEQKSLNTLAGIRMNAYPIINQLRDAETRSNYALNNSGGLTGAQKYLGRIANANNMYSNIADMWANLQERNNAYKQQYASALMRAGDSSANRRQASKQYKEEAYAKSHAARQQQMQMGMRNFMDYINQYSANEFKRRQFNDMLGLYQSDIENNRPKIKNTTSYQNIPFKSSYNQLDYAASVINPVKPNFAPISNINIKRKRKGSLGDYQTWAAYYDLQNAGPMKTLN